MRRDGTGRYIQTSVAGELVRAYVPEVLPPIPALAMEGRDQVALEKATLAVGRLDSICSLLPDPRVFLYTYVRKEAVLSSQIEGTQSSLSDLLLFELEEAPGTPLEDVTEVSNYVAALEHGMRRMRDGFPLSNRLIREMHAILMNSGRGSEKAPGEFRRSQNWLGGTRPGNAVYVPPPPQEVEPCMAALERFIHDEADGMPVLIRAALAHVQFETIHPFLDGNGRLGRLLIALMLTHGGVLSEPLLYVSLFFKQHRSIYYELLNQVRTEGDWETWVAFFLEGVEVSAEEAVRMAAKLTALFRLDTEKIAGRGSALANARELHSTFMRRPLLTLRYLSHVEGFNYNTASSAMKLLIESGIARELTGRKRDRVFVYTAYHDLLMES